MTTISVIVGSAARGGFPKNRRSGFFSNSRIAGTDFIIARDGKIAAVYLFFDKLP